VATSTRWLIAGIAALVLAGIVVFIGWQAGWWLTAHNVQRGYSVTVSSQAYQTSLDAEMSQNVSNIGDLAVTRAGIPASSPQQAVIRAQQLNQLILFCKESLQLVNNNPGYASLEATAQANCAAGAPLPQDPPLAAPVPAP